MQFRYIALLVVCTTCALHSMEREEDLSKTVLFTAKLKSLDALEKLVQQKREDAQQQFDAHKEEKNKKQGARAVAQLIACHFNAQEQEKICDAMRTFYEQISTTDEAIDSLNNRSSIVQEYWNLQHRKNNAHKVAALITAYNQEENSDEESSSEEATPRNYGWGETFWKLLGY